MKFYVEDYKKRMTLIAEEGGAQLYEYLPSAFMLMAINFENPRLVRQIRFLLEYLHRGHYKVYYLAVDSEFVGYCVVTPGGRRLSVSTKKDIVLGPYFVSPKHRGKGYAKMVVKMTLEHCTYDYEYAFDWIHETNIPSIKTSEACGFIREGHRLNVVGLMRKLVLNDKGDNIIFKYSKQ